VNRIQESARELEVLAEADVVVAGGGPGGFPAAIAAARQGAKTVLIERYGFLGGMATAGFVGPILGHTAHKSNLPIIGGIPHELCDRLHAEGGGAAWKEAIEDWGVRFEPEILKIVLDDMVLGAGVEVLLHTFVADAVVQDGRIEALIIESKSGRQAVTGKMFVDATGDADVAFRAGAPTHKGRAADGMPMAMGSMFRVGGVKPLDGDVRQKAAQDVIAARERGEVFCYGAGVETRSSTLRSDHITPNMTRFSGDPTNVLDLTRGEITVRKDTWAIVNFFRENVPGYEGAYLAALPAQIGLRESRQIEGDYAVTGDDIVNAARFDDVVALGSWWIDIHCPLGRTKGNVHICRVDCCADPPCDMLTKYKDQLPSALHPPDGGWYDIPFRSIVANGASNLLASGRCISATHVGMAGTRVMGTCMALGQAAGTAAALAADKGVAAATLPVKELQDTLTKDGAVLHPKA